MEKLERLDPLIYDSVLPLVAAAYLWVLQQKIMPLFLLLALLLWEAGTVTVYKLANFSLRQQFFPAEFLPTV